ncbi:MAG: MBL fold metallo-hydrolase [Gemmatimonadota bacterium]|jgi:phosphoribosyl 1,2-cyclic phosphodiesterase
MRITILGSGSKGNAILLEAHGTRILVDAGFSARDLERRLRLVGVGPEEILGIVITHDHSDHTRGMGVFARRFGTPLYLTDPTRVACKALLKGGEETRTYRAGFPFSIGNLMVEPFLTVHDATDPVAVAVRDTDTGFKVGVATDLGRPTAQVRHALSGSDFLVLEANHDAGLLHQGPYPWSVKSRIASSHGHLSNEAAATLALELLHPRLAGVVLAHLSAECNRAALARAVVGRALQEAGYRGFLSVAEQDQPTGPLSLPELARHLVPHQLPLI